MTRQKTDEDPWVLYIIAKKHLKLSPGKLAAQVGHSIDYVHEHISSASKKEKQNFEEWKNNARTKIVLSVNSDEEFEEIKNIFGFIKFVVVDAGFTEIPSGTETVISFLPVHKTQRPIIFNNLKLY